MLDWRGLTAAILLCLCLPAVADAQQRFVLEERIRTKGVIRSISAGAITITDEKGRELAMKIQGKDEEAVSIAGATALLRFPAEVKIEGAVDLKDVKPGVLVRLEGKLNRIGRTSGQVESLTLFDEKAHKLGVEVKKAAAKSGAYADCVIAAEVFSFSPKSRRLILNLAPNEFTRKTRIAFTLSKEAKVALESNDYRRGKRGDKVTQLEAARFNTGDILVKQITIALAPRAEATTAARGKRKPTAANGKYRNLSDAPRPPRDLRSPHFLLHTDVSDRNARVLLDKLEIMVALVSQYYGAPPKGLIECYVVRDLKNWQGRLPASAVAKISEPAGVTVSSSIISSTSGRSTKSIVYACDDHGVVQHEAIHAYCSQTFGDTGPTWYSEGMAEMGQYWKKNQREVDIDPVVIDYLKNAEPKKMLDIVAAGQVTGDSWRAYSWRWALCHLLANNPNYSGRFKGLGMAMMSGQPGASFESVYGPVAREISFEYDLFVKQLDNGYRADLCAWQWNRKFLPLKRAGNTSVKVLAKYGWQATSARLEAGQSYDAAAKGEWKLDAKEKCTADGLSSGEGKLIAIVLNDEYELGEPFELGARRTFVAKTDGHLYVRCREAWNRLGDNDGDITVYLRRTPRE